MGRTPLHLARKLAIVQYLVEKAPDGIRLADRYGSLPLHLADSLSLVQFLVAQDPGTVRAVDHTGCTPLHRMCKYGHSLEIVRFLVQQDPAIIHITDNNGATPLYQASEWGNLKTVQFLCGQGAVVTVQDLLAACNNTAALAGYKHLTSVYLARQLVVTQDQQLFELPAGTPTGVASRAFAAMASALQAESQAHAAYRTDEEQRLQGARDLFVQATCAMKSVIKQEEEERRATSSDKRICAA
jgi:ankyrin repeat protein